MWTRLLAGGVALRRPPDTLQRATRKTPDLLLGGFGELEHGHPADMLLQVTFLLDGAAETRYLAAPPSAGESVHALGREWLVRDVVEDEGHYVVVCSALEGPRRARRGRGSGSLARGS